MRPDRNQESGDRRPQSGCRNVPITQREDATIQSAVLALLLDQHPTQLTLAELVREVAEDPANFAQRDAISRAVRGLAGAGLLHCHGEFVIPTRAAIFFERLTN